MTTPAQAPSDNCGECVTQEDAVTAKPYLAQPDGLGGMRAYYRCSRCGARWWTAWHPGAAGLTEYARKGAA